MYWISLFIMWGFLKTKIWLCESSIVRAGAHVVKFIGLFSLCDPHYYIIDFLSF